MTPLQAKILLISFFSFLITFNIIYYRKYPKLQTRNLPVVSKQTTNVFVKQIWQVQPKDETEDEKKYIAEWKKVPGWEYSSFSNEEAVKSYLHTKYPQLNIHKLFEENKKLGLDLLRYTVIYEYGGLNIHSRVEKAEEFNESMDHLKHCGVIIGVEGDLRDEKGWADKLDRSLQFSHTSFYATPKHPLIGHIVDMAYRNIEYYHLRGKDFKELHPSEGTGAGVFTDSVLDYLSVTSGVSVTDKIKCGSSYTLNDVCILNARGFSKNTHLTCGEEKTDNSYVVAISHIPHS